MFSIRSSFSDSSRDVAMATNFVAKLWPNQLPPTLIALAFRNGIGYRYLNGRINSVNDASTSCENFVQFGLATPELTELICERQVRHGQKTDVFSGISPDILDRFSQSFHYMRVLWVQMMNLDLIIRFGKGRCHGNQIILREMRNDTTCIIYTSIWKGIGISLSTGWAKKSDTSRTM